MFYPFPVGLTLDEVRSVVNAHNERLGVTAFIEADRGDHVIFNYVVSFDGSFPQPATGDPDMDRQYAIIRECRGLTFCKNTGKVLVRKYQKYFNVNEKEFTQAHLIDWSQPHIILEKLDGSMITPMWSGDECRWATKMGMTEQAEQVEEFLKTRQEYYDFAAWCDNKDLSPIFEWCSRKNKVVIDYPEDKLVLTAVRDKHDGSYMSYNAMCVAAECFGIPVVRALPGSVENIQEFIAETRGLMDQEGYVIRFDNGHMVKIKADHYCMIHGTKELLQYEKDVLALILEDKIDDAKAFMDQEDRDIVERFMTAFEKAVEDKALDMQTRVERHKADLQGDKKRFALEVAPTCDPLEKPMLFSIWDGKSAKQVLRAQIAKNVGTSTKVETVRPLFGGLRWSDFRYKTPDLDN